MKKVTIYTDGGYRSVHKVGSWAFTAKCMEYTLEKHGTKTDTTNNIMELEAVCEALEALTEPCDVKVFSDSVYVVNGFNVWKRNWIRNGWKNTKGQAILNKEVWVRLVNASKRFDHKLKFTHVKAHRGNVGNERADTLCCIAMDNYLEGFQ